MIEKRRHTPEADQANRDRITKQVVVGTICTSSVCFSATVCILAFLKMPVPNELMQITMMSLTGLLGMLVKTGQDTPVKAAEPATGKADDPVKVDVVDNGGAG